MRGNNNTDHILAKIFSYFSKTSVLNKKSRQRMGNGECQNMILTDALQPSKDNPICYSDHHQSLCFSSADRAANISIPETKAGNV